jgi:hypothetical protein
MRIVKFSLMIMMLFALSCRLMADSYLAYGNVSGYVSNYYGLAVSGAIIGVENGPVTTSGSDGYYLLRGVTEGEQTVGCGKAGYNIVRTNVIVISNDTVFQNFTLTQPTMVINPLVIEQTINPGEYFTTSLNILNTGTGPLSWQAGIDYISMPVLPCEYSIALYDTWGDGWNGCSVDVLVNDSVVLDHITLSNGAGPEYFYFTVFSGDTITTDFNPVSFVSEPYYYIYDGEGSQVWYSPPGPNGPPDILPGQLDAACQGGQWLTMDLYQDTVQPFGGVSNVPTHLDATGTNSGEVYQANIVFTSTPFVGEITVPVTITIQGNEIAAPDDLVVELIDDVSGKVKLTWDWNGDSFQFFVIKRDGMIIATTTSRSYIDILRDHGTFCYTVQALYDEGSSSPAGPECVEWPNPVLKIEPDSLDGWVWTGFTVDVFTTISNRGEGTLSYSFPEFAALDLLNDPRVEKNKTGSPPGTRAGTVQKGDEKFDGSGYPIVLGAGGPDDFGYIWIDSDETGGPSFSYTDISTTGNPVFGLLDDNVVGPYSIGFDFYFYGQIKNHFWVNANGCVGFTSNRITLGNTAIPTNSSVYKDFVAWMWDDLVFKTGTSQVFYQAFPDKLIIQFKNYEQYNYPNLFINAELIIYKNGKLMLMYHNFDPGVILNSCTVGIQSSDPEVGLQVVFNTPYLHNDLAILLNVHGDFITEVDPEYGTVPEGGSEVISITYNSGDYVPGPYTQELLLESNDLDNKDYVIENTMHVYLPARFSGLVYDNNNEDPLNGVLVTAGPFQSTTGEDGQYNLYVDEGNYDLIFEKLGYTSVIVEDTFALKGEATPVSTGMWDMDYPPGFVSAEVMDDDTWCRLTWSLPQGPYEIIMDDGEADDFFVFAHFGSWHAVKFTPSGYPATVIGGEFYVGDGSFPGPFLGTDFGVAVFDDDGENGLPGTMLDSNGVTVNNSGWVSLDWLNAVVNDGSFYLAMYQSGNSPFAAPIGIDSDTPTHFKSYSKFLANNWSLSPLQDFMIRAWINGPQGDNLANEPGKVLKAVPRVPANWKEFAMTRSGALPKILPGFELNNVTYKGVEGVGNRDVNNYLLSRYSNFDPDGSPANGTLTELSTVDDLYYNDNAWAELPRSWYAYGVKALYSNGAYSNYTLSNIVGHLMDHRVTVNVSLTTGQEPLNAQVTLQGLEYPYETYHAVTPESGTVLFDLVWKGHYNMSVNKIGYDIYNMSDINVNNDKIFNIILSEKKYPPTGLYVDPLSLIATWNKPLKTALYEDFENPVFPPAGWQSLVDCDSTAWIRTDNLNSSWVVPPWDSYYAVFSEDIAGSDCNGCCEYLITPPLDLRETEDYAMTFDSYYDGAFGELAFVKYSVDEGATWEVLTQIMPATTWTSLEIDLSAFSGPSGPEKIWFAFHADNGNWNWPSGWAIDNVKIQSPAPAANYMDFTVFLDDAFVGETPDTTWNFAPLAYGQTYTVSVAAHYSSGSSSKDYYTFTSTYLVPPQNLTGSAPEDATILLWDPPGSSVPFNLQGYNIYRDDVFIGYIMQIGGWVTQSYIDQNLQPGIYSYGVTGVYDLTPYGLPGETGESMKAGPEMVTVDYCHELEFLETWSVGSFENDNWISDGPNWSIDGMMGNPVPSAEFAWNPVQTNYEISLESYPLCALGLTEGHIWLDFDLALHSILPTGLEMLKVEVWGWDTQVWNTVAQYSNSNSGFDWTTMHLNISSGALNRIFKVRFTAEGVKSDDIRGWFVDNIHVYRKCTAPERLAIDPGYSEGIRLTWQLSENIHDEGDNGTRELTAFYVYRSMDGDDFELIGTSQGMVYIDPDSNLVMGSSYCYKVNAVWNSQTDQCESDFSNEACVLWTGIAGNDISVKDNINIYPNPATDHVFIDSPDGLDRIMLYDALGRLVFDRIITGGHYELKTVTYPAGAYIIRVETSAGVASRLLTIQR